MFVIRSIFRFIFRVALFWLFSQMFFALKRSISKRFRTPRSKLPYFHFQSDPPPILSEIVGVKEPTNSRAGQFMYATGSRKIRPLFSGNFRSEEKVFCCAAGLFHNVNHASRNFSNDESREFTLVYQIKGESFTRKMSLSRIADASFAAEKIAEGEPLSKVAQDIKRIKGWN